MSAVVPLRLSGPDAKPGYDHLDPISLWFLGGATAGADASGIVDDDRYGLNVKNAGAGGLSLMALSGDGGRFLRVDNTAVAIGGGLSVTGPVTFSSSVTISGTLAVTGAATFRSTIDVTGATTLRSSLTVTGPATFVTDVTMNQGLTVNQSVSIQGNLDVDGSLALGSSTSTTLATLGDWTLSLSGDDLVFKDDAGGEMFRIGDAASTYHAVVTGPMHITGNLELENDINHDGNAIGFFGSAPSTKETITGVRTGTLGQLQTVVGNILSAGANYGLWTDSTT